MDVGMKTLNDRFVELAGLSDGGRVVDLGCGRGPALAAFGARDPQAHLTGFDRSAEALKGARGRLLNHAGTVELEAVDLGKPLPLDDEVADVVVSSNLLECLPDPVRLLNETWRVLRPGGRAVFSHSDFDALVIAGASTELDRKIGHAFSDDAPAWMDSSDGRIGRKLPGMVQASSLVRTHVETWMTTSTELSGHAARRVDGIRGGLLAAARRGRGLVSTGEVEAWYDSIQQAAEKGEFFFSEMAVVVVAGRL
ncbi:methyltransferase domain-containing protein [Streptomyces sp. NPDC056682]|uniref:methyltransferase domain-containing protein n=1 Tax=Streptomyces sp. NPDC056682 TaxID=3345909 RepID=UPI0036B87DE2